MAHVDRRELVPMLVRMLFVAALMVVLLTLFSREWQKEETVPSIRSEPVAHKTLADQKKIRDNDSAEDIVTVGMTAVEVKNRVGEPEPNWTMFMLKEWGEDDALRITISQLSGDPLVLTTVGGDVPESPYYAWVFFSPHSRIWDPTFVYFQTRDDTVIHVGRFDCNDSLAALALCSWEVASEY